MPENSDAAYTQAAYTVAELQVLLDLAAARLFELQADFRMLQDQIVLAHAQLAALPAEPSAGDPDSIWGDRLSQ